MITVVFASNGDKTVSTEPNTNLLRLSIREKGGIPFKCGAGLCGTCECRISGATDAVKPKERKHLTEEKLAAGHRMACQTFLVGDVTVTWEPKLGKPA